MDALDNLVGNVHLLRTDGGVRLMHPMGHAMMLPTPIAKPDLATLFLALSEGWLIAGEPREHEPQAASRPTTPLQRKSTTSRRRR